MAQAQLESDVTEPVTRATVPRVRDQLKAVLLAERAAEATNPRRNASAGVTAAFVRRSAARGTGSTCGEEARRALC